MKTTKGVSGFLRDNPPLGEPLTEKAFDELEIAFQSTPGPKWLMVHCPFCKEWVGVGELPEGTSVSKCEHELRLVEPFRKFAEKRE